jgi:hypothetical protein
MWTLASIHRSAVRTGTSVTRNRPELSFPFNGRLLGQDRHHDRRVCILQYLRVVDHEGLIFQTFVEPPQPKVARQDVAHGSQTDEAVGQELVSSPESLCCSAEAQRWIRSSTSAGMYFSKSLGRL